MRCPLTPFCCLRYCKSTIFQANHNAGQTHMIVRTVVCDTAKVRFFKQITTRHPPPTSSPLLFAILQKYDFSSKSQHISLWSKSPKRCLRYCKSTIFQANHNTRLYLCIACGVVCDTAKVRFFKQITTIRPRQRNAAKLFAILQKYDFSSKSQLTKSKRKWQKSCLRYCKSTIFQANHNFKWTLWNWTTVVCDTAKVRFFKQITTKWPWGVALQTLFAILQKYDFSSKSQRIARGESLGASCLRYCKSTIFQANHNAFLALTSASIVVCDTAKVRFFKQITTYPPVLGSFPLLFAILQKYDFSSKSQQVCCAAQNEKRCLRYCKSTIFQANHNRQHEAQ